MARHPETFDHMLAAWNEREPAKVRGHLEQALSADVRFVDPTNELTGVDAFEAMVHEFRAQNPDAVCSRASGVARWRPSIVASSYALQVPLSWGDHRARRVLDTCPTTPPVFRKSLWQFPDRRRSAGRALNDPKVCSCP